MKYGLPYQGSKSVIADKIVELFPPAEHFYDVFAGGCAITHAALLSGKFKTVHFNDLNDSVVLFKDAMEGNIPDGSKWISREEFKELKDSDPYVRLVWSFGNNQRDYLYSVALEPYKKAVHDMVFAKSPNEIRLKFKDVCRLIPDVIANKGKEGGGYLDALITHASLQQHNRTAAISSTFKTQAGLSAKNDESESNTLKRETPPINGGGYVMSLSDYRDIEILPNSVIYADPPYKGTREYRDWSFDHEAFYDWVRKQEALTFVSEYQMPDDFIPVLTLTRRSTFSAQNKTLKKTENVYIHESQIELFKQLTNNEPPHTKHHSSSKRETDDAPVP